MGPLAWLLALMLDGELLLADASIRNFQGGKGGYVANAVEQVLLLPGDMAKLRGIRRHEVFLSLKRYLVQPFPISLVYFLYLLSLILVNFLGKLFKPPFGQRRLPIPAIGK